MTSPFVIFFFLKCTQTNPHTNTSTSTSTQTNQHRDTQTHPHTNKPTQTNQQRDRSVLDWNDQCLWVLFDRCLWVMFDWCLWVMLDRCLTEREWRLGLVWGVSMDLASFAMKVFDIYSQWAWKRRSKRKWGVWDGGEAVYGDLTKKVWIRPRGRGDLCSEMGIEMGREMDIERERERATNQKKKWVERERERAYVQGSWEK